MVAAPVFCPKHGIWITPVIALVSCVGWVICKEAEEIQFAWSITVIE
jgi:hypothetical protein